MTMETHNQGVSFYKVIKFWRKNFSSILSFQSYCWIRYILFNSGDNGLWNSSNISRKSSVSNKLSRTLKCDLRKNIQQYEQIYVLLMFICLHISCYMLMMISAQSALEFTRVFIDRILLSHTASLWGILSKYVFLSSFYTWDNWGSEELNSLLVIYRSRAGPRSLDFSFKIFFTTTFSIWDAHHLDRT